jgi:hypothetical protein
MMAQMAATAGSVAVGSTIGHGLSSMLFGGSSARNPEPAEVPLAQQAQTSQFSSTAPASCAVQAKGECCFCSQALWGPCIDDFFRLHQLP